MANARQLEPKKWILQSYKNGIRKTFRGTSRGEVEKAERDWLNDLETYGKELKKDKVSLDSTMKAHLLINVKLSVSLGTFERYMSLYKTHIRYSTIGNMDIKDIMQEHLQKFFNSKSNLSKKSLSMLKFLITQAFDYAIDNNYIRNNPMKKVKLPKSKHREKEIEVLTLEEQKKYLATAQNSFYKLLFITALSTGMRVGEIIALKWKNVDLIKNVIHVKESSRLVTKYDDEGNALKDEVVTMDPKTSAGKRDIPISKELSTELKKHWLASGSKDTDYVFKNSKGNQIKYDSIAKAHKLVCEKSYIKIVTFHCLRHTFATRLIEQGVDPKTVSQLLGHTDVKITLNRYVHSTKDSKIDAIEKLQKAISTL